jgi:hypothetical protein
MRSEARSSVLRFAVLGGAVLCVALSGCKSKSVATDKPASDTPAAAQPAGTGSAAAVEATAAAAANPNGKCPAGRWSYDYSDQALEQMMKSLPGAKVVKKEGSFICTVSEGAQGTVVCETQGKPVENVVETNQAGMKMVISVTIDGKATTQFTLLDAQRMKVVSSDTSKLKIGTKVTLAGKPMPFPGERLVSIFGKPESVLGYKCEDGKLFIKGQLEKTEAPWQRLDPAK